MSPDAIVFAGLMPHAPVLVPGVAPDLSAAIACTAAAMTALARRAVAAQPDTLLLLSPHSPGRPQAVPVWRTNPLRASYLDFGAEGEDFTVALDEELADAIARHATLLKFSALRIDRGLLDHGAAVPLWFMRDAGWLGPVAVVGVNELPRASLRLLGHVLADAASHCERRVALIASGDMSHCLSSSSPCGYHPAGRQFDAAYIELLRSGSAEAVFNLDPVWCETAAEDVVATTCVASAATRCKTTGRRVFSYEAPFGVGYGVAVLFEPTPDPPPADRTAAADESPSERSAVGTEAPANTGGRHAL